MTRKRTPTLPLKRSSWRLRAACTRLRIVSEVSALRFSASFS